MARCVTYPVAVTWMRKRDHNCFANAASLLICGLLAGVVVAAAAFPAVAMGWPGREGGRRHLRQSAHRAHGARVARRSATSTPPTARRCSPRCTTRTGATSSSTDDRRWSCSNAIIAAEDHRFYEHHGVDVKGVARAFVANQGAGGDTAGRLDPDHAVRPPGASTTRRPARPRWSRATERHRRPQAPRDEATRCTLEKKLTKDQILERYLNIAAFGHGAYGIYAASQVYFGKEPEGPHAGRGGPARRPGQGAHTNRPGHRATACKAAWTGATYV